MGNYLAVLEGAPPVCVGDSVVINLEEDTVKQMQDGHGGWDPPMRTYLGKKGMVADVNSNGDVLITFGIAIYVYNPNIVAKVLRVGDIVQITSDQKKAKFLLKNHGGWVPMMEHSLGGIAEVKKVWESYDVTVFINGRSWRLNPLLCTVIKKSSSNSHSDSDMASNLFNGFAKMMMGHVLQQVATDSSTFRAEGLTELHASATQGDERKTKELLEKGVNINGIDRNGDTALHVAVEKNNLNIVQLLLKKGARVDILNGNNVAPIHIAVHKSYRECLKELLDSSINIEDINGNTPLGWAIERNNHDIIDVLLDHPNINLTKRNKKDLSAYHIAAKSGDTETVRKILQKNHDIVDIQKADGYSALHLAALNDYLGVAKLLIKEAKAKLNVKSFGGYTPLMLAAQKNHFDMVKLLVDGGADINAQNENNSTSLHHVVMPNILSGMKIPTRNRINVIKYLVENGASLSIRNKQGKTPLDFMDDESLKKDLKTMADQSQHLNQQKPCLICAENEKLETFQPCGHQKICVACFIKNNQIKKCMECQVGINGRI